MTLVARVRDLGPWGAIGLALAAFVLWIAVLALLRRTVRPPPELLRKLVHAGSGLMTLAFPFLFADVWPVVLLSGASACALAALKFLPLLRRHVGGVVADVRRTTLGEIYFPVAVATVFWLAHGRSPLLFVIPVLVLTLADATCALVGARYGQSHYLGANKSLEGSVAFVVVAFLCIHVPLLLWGDVGRLESLLIAATLSLVVMLLEGTAWRGLDNLFIPVGGYFVLSAYLALDAAALAGRFAAVLTLVAIVLASRRYTTLEDDSLLAGAFLSYITWALMGWRWLVPVAVLFVGYAWVSPRTAANSRRMHAVRAVLAVWAAAVVWLAAGTRGVPGALFAFTIVFASHLAMFGLSRLAFDEPARPVRPLLARAVAAAWVLEMPLWIGLAGPTPGVVALALLAAPILALAALGFTWTNPSIHDSPQTLTRWVAQASWAGAASLLGWAAARFASGG